MFAVLFIQKNTMGKRRKFSKEVADPRTVPWGWRIRVRVLQGCAAAPARRPRGSRFDLGQTSPFLHNCDLGCTGAVCTAACCLLWLWRAGLLSGQHGFSRGGSSRCRAQVRGAAGFRVCRAQASGLSCLGARGISRDHRQADREEAPWSASLALHKCPPFTSSLLGAAARQMFPPGLQ